MTIATMHWRTTWSNGDPTYWVTYFDVAGDQQEAIERAADEMGFQRDGGRWEPPGDRGHLPLFEAVRPEGVKIDFGEEDRDVPFDLQRLRLNHGTRWHLENLSEFVLFELAGCCPVQASGMVDQTYWYFRARGAYWRFEVGGNETGTKGPTWWYEEEWPSETGFEAGYMSGENAIVDILKSVEKFRSTDKSPYSKGHPDYERTTLQGWRSVL
ncbi:hypothetical protein [Neorhizobium tomejilense]|uniref:hypothetical protein n=1 Tax=Neorhizobium tomejilense TaxID=2093828 RepID=UPI001FE12424|nr:hypothetical protein [Neorhizobium tomejilense]